MLQAACGKLCVLFHPCQPQLKTSQRKQNKHTLDCSTDRILEGLPFKSLLHKITLTLHTWYSDSLKIRQGCYSKTSFQKGRMCYIRIVLYLDQNSNKLFYTMLILLFSYFDTGCCATLPGVRGLSQGCLSHGQGHVRPPTLFLLVLDSNQPTKWTSLNQPSANLPSNH